MTPENMPDAYTELMHQSGQAGEMVFSEPWMARVFSLVIALSEKQVFSLPEFQAALISAIRRREDANCVSDDLDYYTCWLEALMSLLNGQQILAADLLSETEKLIVIDAAARRDHQHNAPRNPDGSLKLQPLVIA
jgi:nitrile hydratase accessory protein